MANEQLTIQPNDARMTVIGKSWPDQASDSGGGDWDNTYNGTYSGPIPRTDLPTKIAVTTPPTKQEYGRLDRIEFDGMVVTAYNEDGSVWTSTDYPDGTIPLNEIISTRRTAKGVAQPEDNTVLIGSYKDGETAIQFFLCNHLHIEGVVDDRVGSYTKLDFNANDGFFIVVEAGDPFESAGGTGYMQPIGVTVVSERENSYGPSIKEGVQCGSGVFDYKTGWWDGSDQYHVYNLQTGRSTQVSTDSGYRSCRYAKDKNGLFEYPNWSFVVGKYQCNLPLFYVAAGATSHAHLFLANKYLRATSFENVSDVTLYWQRPGDGLYLSCTLPIFIKSDDSD